MESKKRGGRWDERASSPGNNTKNRSNGLAEGQFSSPSRCMYPLAIGVGPVAEEAGLEDPASKLSTKASMEMRKRRNIAGHFKQDSGIMCPSGLHLRFPQQKKSPINPTH